MFSLKLQRNYLHLPERPLLRSIGRLLSHHTTLSDAATLHMLNIDACVMALPTVRSSVEDELLTLAKYSNP